MASGSPQFHHPQPRLLWWDPYERKACAWPLGVPSSTTPSPVCSGGIPMKERHVLGLWAEAHGCGSQRCQELMSARTGFSVNLLLWSSGDSTTGPHRSPERGEWEQEKVEAGRGRGGGELTPGEKAASENSGKTAFPCSLGVSTRAQFTPQTLAEDMLCPRPRREAGGAAGMTPKESRPWWRTHSDGGKTSQEP